MRILIVLHGPFDCNSGIQVFHFANELAALGHEPAVCAPGPRSAVERVGEPRFECLSPRSLRIARDRFDIVHAWTPREGVRKVAEPVVEASGCPYLVHLEDNEELLLATHAQLGYEQIERLPPRLQKRVTTDGAIHPRRYPRFLAAAAAVTVITPELSRFAHNEHWTLLRPGVDSARFAPDGEAPSRSSLGIGEEEFVIVYPGNLHQANRWDMLSLYLSVALLRREGLPVRLVRLGSDYSEGADPSFMALREDVIELESRPWHEVATYLRLANALVQPGAPDEFNRYRLPAKVPEFLACGRPVVLPACNLGNELEHGSQALLLQHGDAVEIAGCLEPLVRDPALAARIGSAGRAFALEQLDWGESTRQLAALYEKVCA